VAINNGASGFLTWDTLGDGTELFNRGVLDAPTVLATGIYAVTASAQAQAFLSAGGGFKFVIHLDYTNEDAVTTMLAPPQNANDFSIAGGCCVFFLTAGATVRVEVVNEDGASSRSFALLEADVQRIT
jgi:hypothetical protein